MFEKSEKLRSIYQIQGVHAAEVVIQERLLSFSTIQRGTKLRKQLPRYSTAQPLSEIQSSAEELEDGEISSLSEEDDKDYLSADENNDIVKFSKINKMSITKEKDQRDTIKSQKEKKADYYFDSSEDEEQKVLHTSLSTKPKNKRKGKKNKRH